MERSICKEGVCWVWSVEICDPRKKKNSIVSERRVSQMIEEIVKGESADR